MEVFSRTLVAVDGSLASAFAVDLALRLARLPRYNAVRFVSVVEREALQAQRSTDSRGPFPFEHVVAAAQAESRRVLDEAIDRACMAQIEATCTVREGRAADAILEEALDYGATCIIVGTLGPQGSARAVLGSCAASVLRRSAVPVLIAHAPPMRHLQAASSDAAEALRAPHEFTLGTA